MSGTRTASPAHLGAGLGVLRIQGPFARPAEAWRLARTIVDEAADALEVIGDFVIPPAGGPPSRDFQTMHFDFGLPLVPAAPADVARFTALHLAADTPPTRAVTRLVPLRALLGLRRWPGPTELIERLGAYGRSHGTRDDSNGWTEGSLARLVEAALGEPAALPSVKTDPDFLCGTEFASLDDELRFFERRGLPLEAVEIDVCLRPGELLVFDNLLLAHGRRGTRQPGELNQRVFGHRALPVEHQTRVRDAVLAAFAPSPRLPAADSVDGGGPPSSTGRHSP